MNKTTRLSELIVEVIDRVQSLSSTDLHNKKSDTAWSKKEILGHLVDSAQANLRRFNEVQYSSAPYIIEKYDQNKLVLTNDYQSKDLQELIHLFKALNLQIDFLFRNRLNSFKECKISIDEKEFSCHFLMVDYMDHLQHHLNQL